MNVVCVMLSVASSEKHELVFSIVREIRYVVKSSYYDIKV
jgi:hypothetical protein